MRPAAFSIPATTVFEARISRTGAGATFAMSTKLCTTIGFGPGMGAALARAFGAEGYNLALVSRTPTKHSPLLAEIEAAGCRAELFPADAG
jgi:short-subunit dehydrogenase